MGVMKLRGWYCLFFAIAIASTVTAARNTISLSPGLMINAGKEEVAVVAMEVAQVRQVVLGGGGRRSLVVSLDDYSPSANHGHDPKNRGGSSKP